MNKQKKSSKTLVNFMLGIICFVWLIPAVGLLVSSFRYRESIDSTGWWTEFPHREYQTFITYQLPEDVNLRESIKIEGVEYDDLAIRDGIVREDGSKIVWESRKARLIGVQKKRWSFLPELTFDNYKAVLIGQKYEYTNSAGEISTVQGENLSQAFLNSLAVTIPATVIPVMIAAFAAYVFAWMKFPGRRLLFIIVVATLVVPLQLALIPLTKDYVKLQLNGTFLSMWLAHTGFGLPLAIYLLHNYISTLPRDILESAFIDGASHFTIFLRLIMPLSVPALASFAIFQFLWVWNDYLVSLVFLGASAGKQVLTVQLANLVGSRGQNWYFLASGAFISMALPLLVFFSLQRYFVRGLTAGSVKG